MATQKQSNIDLRDLRKQLRIDQEVYEHQEEWSDLGSQNIRYLIDSDSILQFQNQDFNKNEKIRQILTWITFAGRKDLQNIWLSAAQTGTAIFYPSNATELFFYWLHESAVFKLVVDVSIASIIVLSLLEPKQCLNPSYDLTINSVSFTTTSLIFICTFVIFFDLILFLKTNHWMKSTSSSWFSIPKISNRIGHDYIVIWQIIRAVTTTLICINCMFRFQYPTLPNLSQVLIPLILIPCREDLKQLSRGILSAVLQLRSIFQLWGLFLIFWAFFGFCLLRRYDEDGDDDGNDYSTGHFATYWKALYVCLHCVMSRPTVLYRLKPIFSQNNFAAFYFVLLTIFGDILISASVISIGTRAFRQFSRQNLNARLCYRYHALVSLHALYTLPSELTILSEQDKSHEHDKLNGDLVMSFVQWYNYCVELPHDLMIRNQNDIKILFLLEDSENTGYITEAQFIRLTAIVLRKVIFFTTSVQYHPQIGEAIEQSRSLSTKNENVVRRHIHDLRLTSNASVSSAFGGLSFLYKPERDESAASNPSYSNSQFQAPRSSDIFYFQDSLQSFFYRQTRLGSIYDWWKTKIFRWYYYQIVIANPCHLSRPTNTSSNTNNTAATNTRTNEGSSNSGFLATIQQWSMFKKPRWEVNLFVAYQGLISLLLVIQTTLLSQRDASVGDVVFGWLIIFCYIFEAIVLTVVRKRSKLELRILWIMNAMQFFLYCILSHDVQHYNSTVLTLIIILQSVRFIQCIQNYLTFDRFVKIIPVLQRALLFYAMILYCFSWFGHLTLCGLIDKDNVQNNDDDSSGWGNFSNLLNFNTIFSSFYTIAICAIISNWSMVMDAALVSNDKAVVVNWIYFYFYAFRFVTVLIILPLLMSCVIQTYMQYYNKVAVLTSETEDEEEDNKDNEENAKQVRRPSSRRPSKPPLKRQSSQASKSFIKANNKLTLDYYHITFKYRETDSIAALWSNDGKAKFSVVQLAYGGRYEVKIEDLFSPEVIDSLHYQISVTKKSLWRYYLATYEKKHPHNKSYSPRIEGHKSLSSSTNPLHHTTATKLDKESPASTTTSEAYEDFRSHVFRNRQVMLFQLSDAMILRKQLKWMKEYHQFEKSCQHQNYRFIDTEALEQARLQFTATEKGKLGVIWFEDSIRSLPLIYPADSFALNCLRVSHSVRMTNALYLIAILQMLAVFLIIPQCFTSGSPANDAGTPIISLRALGVFDACCVLIYVIDIALDYFACWKTYRTYSWLEVNGKSWMVLRCIAIVFLLWKSVFSIADADSIFNNLRLVRIFFPLLVVSRSVNFLDIFYGIGLSMRETKAVYLLFIFFLFIFSFSGFWLFQRFSTHAERFKNIIHSILTILQCSTSAPFSLFVILPYNDISRLSPIFFLVLSYATEILCINLVIGTGNVFFNRYGENMLAIAKERQWNSFLAIFFLLAASPKTDVEGEENRRSSINRESITDSSSEYVTFSQFMEFAKCLPPKYFLVPYDENPRLFEETLLSLLFYVKKDVLLIEEMIQMEEVLLSMDSSSTNKTISSAGKINREDFIQLVFLIFNGVVSEKIDHQSRVESVRFQELLSRHTEKNQQNEKDSDKESIHWTSRLYQVFHSPSPSSQSPTNTTANTETNKTTNTQYLDDRENPDAMELAPVKTSNRPDPSSSSSVSVTTTEKKKEAETAVSVPQVINLEPVEDEIPLLICEISTKLEEITAFSIEFFQELVFQGTGWRAPRKYFIAIIQGCQFLTFQQMILFKRQPISVLDLFSFIAHFLLLVQLIYFSSNSLSSESWLILGYFLETFFWLEMIVRMIAFGELRFFSDSIQVVRGLINFLTFFFQILMDRQYDNTTNGFYLLVVTLQCFRLFLFCTRVRGNGRYRVVIKNTIRVLSLLFLILYFWTIIAQELFCGILTNDTVTGSVTADDDASNWNQFSHILNFNNYQQTLFTLFEVTVLGSWSMVMDAAAREATVSAIPLIFFFTFKLLMTFVILPMIMSFMVRSFIALYDQITFVRRYRREKEFAAASQTRPKLLPPHSQGGGKTPTTIKDSQERNFYNPMNHYETEESNQNHDYDDEFQAPIQSVEVTNAKNSPTKPSDSNSLWGRLQQWRKRYLPFHYRPPKPNRYFFSLAYVELWDMSSLKEADDTALYLPMENQMLLNLENYRLQLQYYSYLLYLYRRHHRESSNNPRNESEAEERDDNDEWKDLSLVSRSRSQDTTEDSEGDEEDETERDDAEDRFDAVNESLFERPVTLDQVLAADQNKKLLKRRSNKSKRVSKILDEMRTASKLDNAAAVTVALNLSEGRDGQHRQEGQKTEEATDEVKVLLQVNHSLSQIINSIFIDSRVDTEEEQKTLFEKKVARRRSFTSRFSIYKKDDNIITTSTK